MIRNDADDFAHRLYARLPDHYRAYDLQRGYPLLALLSAVGFEAAAIRADLDTLWDNFFIETCEDWVVPYIGALLGTKLLPNPVGQSSRLEVWRAIGWRRARGTPAMLEEMARATTGWPVTFSEFFQQVGWSQHMRHLRAERTFTPSLRIPAHVDRAGHANDPFGHAVDLRAAGAFDAARVDPNGRPLFAWGTPGRYRVDRVGYFAHRLVAFPVVGAAPAPAPLERSGQHFTFDPLGHDRQLFSPVPKSISRVAFDSSPWPFFGKGIAVRSHGIALAIETAPHAPPAQTGPPFTFGGRTDAFTLAPGAGIRVLDRALRTNADHDFTIGAVWKSDGTATLLGTFDVRNGYVQVAAAPAGGGALEITVTSRPSARVRRFPGATIAVSAARDGGLRDDDATFVRLPAGYLAPGSTLHIAAQDTGAPRVFPPRTVVPSAVPARAADYTNGTARLVDCGRLGNVHPTLRIGPATDGTLTVTLLAPPEDFVAATEWIVFADDGSELLIYLPQREAHAAATYLIADDGSSFAAARSSLYAPPDGSLGGLQLARAALGQVLPIPGRWPLEQRRPIGVDASRATVAVGEVGIDPERGRLLLAATDVVDALTVDYVEACSADVGANASSAGAAPDATPARLLVAADGRSRNGRRTYTTIVAALQASRAGDSIEIVDSTTYAHTLPLDISHLQALRAGAGQRPVVTFRAADGSALPFGLLISQPGTALRIEGLLISGAPIRVDARDARLQLTNTTIDPRSGRALNTLPSTTAGTGSLTLSRCICGPLEPSNAFAEVTIADSIVDGGRANAIGSEPLPAGNVKLERSTIFGALFCATLSADTVLAERAVVTDRQAGSVRFSRFAPESALPRRFATTSAVPSFDARTWGRPEYARLAVRTPPEIRTGSPQLGELGAFASALAPVRGSNLVTKSAEFLPAALTAIVIAET